MLIGPGRIKIGQHQDNSITVRIFAYDFVHEDEMLDEEIEEKRRLQEQRNDGVKVFLGNDPSAYDSSEILRGETTRWINGEKVKIDLRHLQAEYYRRHGSASSLSR
jgi:hypothetical protein